jgi:hypothetical protein
MELHDFAAQPLAMKRYARKAACSSYPHMYKEMYITVPIIVYTCALQLFCTRRLMLINMCCGPVCENGHLPITEGHMSTCRA